ncbi:MAG: division/cell wall cluster transcriptional repressor MraZ [Chitinophagaceae bacterium]|jgi:MraZ protein|nr:division/cell wall cluster transcriptional repressor MraZ [Chitinophagaceae bacterium]MCU0402916.1 division/cell wall cluster transcriptional repressor MraZ [Chitinophagaceae bacterium]
MAGFLGEFEATLDAKNRFLLPAALKRQMPEGTHMLVINRGMDDCLWMYLLDDWKQVEDRLRQVNPYDSRENRLMRRALIAGAVYVEFDSAGRLNLPKNLMEYAGLDKEIMLAGDIDKIEIWDKSKYEKLFDSLTPEKMSAMASGILGSAAGQKM